MINGIYSEYQLRSSYEFREYIHTAVMHVANIIQHEPPETEMHIYRKAMAKMIIETNDPRVDEFVKKATFRAVMEPGIRDTLVQNGQMAVAFADESAVINGLLAIWNETTQAVWPTIADDVTGV